VGSRGFAWNISNTLAGCCRGTLRSCRCMSGGRPAPSSGPKRHAGVCLLGLAENPFKAGEVESRPLRLSILRSMCLLLRFGVDNDCRVPILFRRRPHFTYSTSRGEDASKLLLVAGALYVVDGAVLCGRSEPVNLFLSIAVALVLLPAIAFASPPDPSWIVGIYDDADGDDIVTLIAQTAAAVATSLVQISPPIRLLETPSGLAHGNVQLLQADHHPRGPPPLMSKIHTATPVSEPGSPQRQSAQSRSLVSPSRRAWP
jgi:hypothetical protein